MAYRRRGAAINASALIAAASGSSRSYDELAPPAPAQPRRSESASLRAVALDAQRSVQRARKVGDHLLIEEEGCFFPCEVLQVVEGSRGGWLVHYLGWNHIRDEIVGGPKSAAKVLPDTPEHSLLCADLKAQIRRIQRKGSQLPRGDAKLILKNKVVAATIIETAIRQPEKGTPVTTMHYITFESAPAHDGWYDQAKLRLALPSSVAGCAGPAARQPARGVGSTSAKKVRGMSAKAHLQDERKDAALQRLGVPARHGGSDGNDARADGAWRAGTGHQLAPPDLAASAEDAQLCTWVWYWSGVRSKLLPHDTSRKGNSSGDSMAMRWVETSRANQTGSKSGGDTVGRTATATCFTATWLRQHIEEVKEQSFAGAKVFLRRNSQKVCQRVLAATVLADTITATAAQRSPECTDEQRSQPQAGAEAFKVKSPGTAVPRNEAAQQQYVPLHAQSRKRSSASVTMGQADAGAAGTAGDEKSKPGTSGGHDNTPKRIKRQLSELEGPETELVTAQATMVTVSAPAAAVAAPATAAPAPAPAFPGATLSAAASAPAAVATLAAPAPAPASATNQSMAIHYIAPTQDLDAARASSNNSSNINAGSSQVQLQDQSTKTTTVPVSSSMGTRSASPSASPWTETMQADGGSRHEEPRAAHPHVGGSAQPDHTQGAGRPSKSDRQWSVAEETRLADLVSKYWPVIIDEAQRVGSPILPGNSLAWVKISQELGTLEGSDCLLHSPESCNKHWTTVAEQMQAQQDALEQQQQAQRRRAIEQQAQQAQQARITQERDQLYYEQQQIILAEVYQKLVRQQEAEKQQQQLALQQHTQQYRNAIAQQQQQVWIEYGGHPTPLQQQQLQQNQQLLLLQLQQQQLQQQQALEQQHQQQLQQHQQQQAQSQRPLTSKAVASVLVEGHPSNVIGSLRVVYPLLHKMLRESGFGSNVLPLMGCHGELMVKVSFSFRTPTPSAVKEGEPLVFTMKGAPWLRAMLHQNGVMTDCGFSWSPPDWLDLIETLQQLSSVVQQQSLADGLREALWRRDGRRRTYFCCLLRHNGTQLEGCGIRLLDQNELRQHISKEHAHPAIQRHSRIMLAEMEIQRRKQLSILWNQQHADTAGGNAAASALRDVEDDNAWVVQKTEELVTTMLPSENLDTFRARVRTLRLQEGESVDDDDDCMLSYERVSVRDGTTMTKMSCPGRTRRCKHLQCFDLRSHIQEAYRRRTKWAATGGPPRDANLPGANLVTCAVSACAMEVDVAELVKDEYFAAVLGALKQQGVDPEQVDIDPSVGNWRPSPVDRTPSANAARVGRPAAPAGSRELTTSASTAGSSAPDSTQIATSANTAAAAQAQQESSSGAATSSPGTAMGEPGMKTEVDPNAPTFYDLT